MGYSDNLTSNVVIGNFFSSSGYSLITKPWQCLIFEALESVTSSLSFTAAVTYAAKLSTTTTDTSIQGLLGGLYYGVGEFEKKRRKEKKKVII